MTLAERLRRDLIAASGEPMLPGDLPEHPDAADVPAAVLIAMTDRPEPGVILTVRRDDMRTHAGQVAFPGGRLDPTDVLPSPLNVQFLRAVRRLPSVAGYFVVARRQPMRAASEVLVRLGGPHRVFRSVDDALAEVRAASERPRTP